MQKRLSLKIKIISGCDQREWFSCFHVSDKFLFDLFSRQTGLFKCFFVFFYFWQTFIFTATMSKNFHEKYYHERLYGFLTQYAETSINLETVKVPNGYKSTLFVYGESSISHTHSKRSNQKKMFYFDALTVLLSKNSWLGNLIYLYFFNYYSNNNFLFE